MVMTAMIRSNQGDDGDGAQAKIDDGADTLVLRFFDSCRLSRSKWIGSIFG